MNGEWRTFTSADLELMYSYARERDEAARRLDAVEGRGWIQKFRDDHIRAHVDGFKGEWAVADSLGVPRPADVSGRADDGTDLIAPNGERINVRYTPYRSGRIMCPVARPMKECDWLVLVVGGPTERRVLIAAAVGWDEFYERAHMSDFGYGPTHWIPREGMIPWWRLRAWLLGES